MCYYHWAFGPEEPPVAILPRNDHSARSSALRTLTVRPCQRCWRPHPFPASAAQWLAPHPALRCEAESNHRLAQLLQAAHAPRVNSRGLLTEGSALSPLEHSTCGLSCVAPCQPVAGGGGGGGGWTSKVTVDIGALRQQEARGFCPTKPSSEVQQAVTAGLNTCARQNTIAYLFGTYCLTNEQVARNTNSTNCVWCQLTDQLSSSLRHPPSSSCARHWCIWAAAGTLAHLGQRRG